MSGNERVGQSRRTHGVRPLGELVAVLRDFGSRRQVLIWVVGSLATAAVLVFVLAGQRDEFTAALESASAWVLAVTVLLQIVALLARSEAWHLTIEAAGGTVERRVLYRASSMQVLGGVINGHLGVAARIAALRRSSPEVSPQVPTLIAAEFPIVAVEAALAALASFTLIAPLGLPWWLPVIAIAVIALASAGLRHLAQRKGRELWSGLAVLRSLRGGSLVVAFVLVAVFAQIFRNWMLLHAVGVDASFFDAIAVLIALVTLSSAAGRSERRRRGRGADPRQRRGGGRGGGRGPDDGHGHRRRLLLRGMGGRRPAVVGEPPGRAAAVPGGLRSRDPSR